MFRCLTCGKEFNDAKIVVEPHGERHGVCPHCSSSEFSEWEPNIDKSEIAAKALELIAALNRHFDNLKDLFGNSFSNDDLDETYGVALETIEEMYGDFVTPEISKAIRNMRTQNDINRVLTRLTGV